MGKKKIDHVFAPIKTQQAFKKISEKIKKAIFDGELKPGDRLPSEISLAKQFQVSRQTVREALRLLEMSGFITIRRGSTGGPIIENTVLHAVSNAMNNAIRMQDFTLNDLTTARLETEKSLIKYVVKNADQADIDALSENIVKSKRNADEGIPYFPDFADFHILLAKASKNPVFTVVIESILALGVEYVSRIGRDEENTMVTIAEHENILKAIIEKDADKAIRLMENHVARIGHVAPPKKTNKILG
jgi:DNA-binding FadR family transcriptional regulator